MSKPTQTLSKWAPIGLKIPTCLHLFCMLVLSSRWTGHVLGFDLEFQNNFTGTRYSMITLSRVYNQKEVARVCTDSSWCGLYWQWALVNKQHPDQHTIPPYRAIRQDREHQGSKKSSTTIPYLMLLCIGYLHFLRIQS